MLPFSITGILIIFQNLSLPGEEPDSVEKAQPNLTFRLMEQERGTILPRR
ncbi:MAG: hypothetical protein ANABAC_2688 [Anaerolineae bacterium]|nr:MAG: hypothetical protein ANABAC_2688 [Anaerolineae bacterium]